MRPLTRSLALAPLLALACSSATTPTRDASVAVTADAAARGDAAACTPSREVWDRAVRPLVAQHCGNCHGATPAFGAPFSLLDYDANLRAGASRRPADGMADRLVAGTMPPAGAPAVPDEARRAIVEWASCGAQTTTGATGVRSSRPAFPAPARPLEGVPHFDLLARDFAVGPDVTDLYQCFVFEAPVTEDRFVRRFELRLDESAVVHHVVLLRDPDRSGPASDFRCNSMPASSQYLYAWAPGQDAFEFPEGGLRVAPGHRFIMQIHYNNSAQRPGVTDSTGVRLYHDAPRGPEYGMVAIGPQGFSIPPRSTGSAASFCTIRATSQLLAGMPHMHEVGSSFTQDVIRADGRREPLISLSNWRFETQLLYDLRTTLNAGDRLETRCTYDNPRSETVRSGSGTRDEMCFNFAYLTPPPPLSYCDEGTVDPNQVPYTPGMCARPGAATELPRIDATLRVGDAPTLAGGTLAAGRYELAELKLHLNGLATGLGDIEISRTTVRARGQAWVEADRLTTDLAVGLHLVLSNNVVYDRGLPLAVSGPVTPTTPGNFTMRSDCGQRGDINFRYAADADSLRLVAPAQSLGALRLTTEYLFRRAR